MLAGTASRSITPTLHQGSPVWLAGYRGTRQVESVRDELSARVVVLEQDGLRIALVSLDLIGLFRDEIEALRQRSDFQDLGIHHLLVACTHTHAGPDTLGLWSPDSDGAGDVEAYLEFVRSEIVEGLASALEDLVPVEVELASARTPGLIRDAIPPEVIDDTLRLCHLRRRDRGNTVAVLVSWSNHAEVLGPDNQAFSADFPGVIREVIELSLGGLTLFFAGSIGGLMTPEGVKVHDPETGEAAPESSPRKMRLLGEAVAGIALEALQQAEPAGEALNFQTVRFGVPIENRRLQHLVSRGRLRHEVQEDKDGWVLPTEASLIQIGDARLLAVPGEIYPELVLSGFVEGESVAEIVGEPVMVLGLCNDSLGYILPESGEWHDSINSPGREFAGRLFQALRTMVEFSALPEVPHPEAHRVSEA